jgi:hypothetical protein
MKKAAIGFDRGFFASESPFGRLRVKNNNLHAELVEA